MVISNAFFKALEMTGKKAGDVEIPEDVTLQDMRRVTDALPLADNSSDQEQRSQRYFVNNANLLANGSFETTAMTAWVDEFSSGTGVSSTRATAVAMTLYGSLWSLRLNADNATGTATYRRYQDLTASSGQVWRADALVQVVDQGTEAGVPALVARLRYEFLDVSTGQLETAVLSSTGADSSFNLFQFGALTAPNDTVKLRI